MIKKPVLLFAFAVTLLCSLTYFYLNRQYNPKVIASIENYQFTKEVLDELITPLNRHMFVFEPNYNIITFPNILSKQQCDTIISNASHDLSPSLLGKEMDAYERDAVRKSKTCWLDSTQCPLDDYITDWIISYLQPYFPKIDKSWMERLQVVEYEPGGKFLEHWDNSWNKTEKDPRFATFLFYLNEDYDGGETIFPLLKRGVKGKIGTGLVFYNIDPYSKQIIAESLHVGNTVRKGNKWIATKWVHLQPLELDEQKRSY